MSVVPKAAVVAVFALASASIQADTVYRSVGPDGRVTYSQRPPANGQRVQGFSRPAYDALFAKGK